MLSSGVLRPSFLIAQAQLPDFSSKFLDREPAGLDRLFQKTEQFALQRPMMSHRATAKLCDDSIRDTLDRKIDWHAQPLLKYGSISASLWNPRASAVK